MRDFIKNIMEETTSVNPLGDDDYIFNVRNYECWFVCGNKGKVLQNYLCYKREDQENYSGEVPISYEEWETLKAKLRTISGEQDYQFIKEFENASNKEG